MNSEIRFLKDLEDDLQKAAATESSHALHEARAVDERARRHRPWKAVATLAAAAMVLAWGVGFLAQGGLSRHFPGSQATSAGLAAPAPQDGKSTSGTGDQQALTPEVPAASATPTADRAAAVSDTAAWLATGEHFLGYAPSTNQTGSGKTLTYGDLSKIVRDGSMSLTIPKDTFDRRFGAVIAVANRNGGFVLSSETHGSAAGSLVLRIPAANFDDALLAVRQLGTVVGSSVTGSDVTAEYVDNQARLTILESRRDVLLALMTKATTIGETITVQNALDDVQLHIEQIQGQLRYLDNQVAESTLKVDMRERTPQDERPVPVEQKTDEVQNPSLGRAWDRAIQGFLGVIATIIVGFGYLVPLLVIAGLVALIVTLVRRRGHEAS